MEGIKIYNIKFILKVRLYVMLDVTYIYICESVKEQKNVKCDRLYG